MSKSEEERYCSWEAGHGVLRRMRNLWETRVREAFPESLPDTGLWCDEQHDMLTEEFHPPLKDERIAITKSCGETTRPKSTLPAMGNGRYLLYVMSLFGPIVKNGKCLALGSKQRSRAQP